jgi:hypothetical protein
VRKMKAVMYTVSAAAGIKATRATRSIRTDAKRAGELVTERSAIALKAAHSFGARLESRGAFKGGQV